MSSYKIVCLGGGNAAGYLAKELVAASSFAPSNLAIITDEPVVAYERPALSKGYLAGAARLPGFHTCVGGGGERQDPSWYAAKGIAYLTGTRITAADLATKTLTTASGDIISYEKLVIATGARSTTLADFKTPGSDLEGLFYLRNEADAAALFKAIEATKASGGKAVLVGGGYIGMEVAAALSGHGIPTSIVLPGPHLLSRLFTPKIAEFYEKFYEGKGTAFMRNTKLTGFQGVGGKVTGVSVSSADGDKVLPADLVVVGIGARANTELFASQLELALGGIKVDGHLMTSQPDVYAIGDVATFPLKRYGGVLGRQEHVANCRQMASHVAKELLGASSEEYDYLPFFYSRVFNLSWQFYGASEGADVRHFGDFEAGKFGAVFIKDGQVVGAFLESGSAEENEGIKRLALERPKAPASGDLTSLSEVLALVTAVKL